MAARSRRSVRFPVFLLVTLFSLAAQASDGTTATGVSVAVESAPSPAEALKSTGPNEDVDARLVEIARERTSIRKEIKEELKAMQAIRVNVEAGDAECARIQQRLEAIEKEAADLRRQLDERIGSVSRYQEHASKVAELNERLNRLMVEERKLGMERAMTRQASGAAAPTAPKAPSE